MNFNAFFILPTIHPLLYISFAFALGVCSFFYWPFYASLVVFFCIAIFASYGKNFKKIFKIILACFLAFFIGNQRINYQLNQHDVFLDRIGEYQCDIQGKIIAINKLEQHRMKQSIIIETSTISIHGIHHDSYATQKNIQLYSLKNFALEVGDTVQIKNIQLKKSKNNSYQLYLVKEGIYGSAVLIDQDIVMQHRPKRSWLRSLDNLKNHLLTQCRAKLSKKTFSLFSSIFLGNRSIEKKEMENPKEHCKTWGISHYLARSGLHLVIFVFAWHWLLRIIPFSYIIKEIILLLLSVLYFLLSWSSVSFLRAFLTFIFYKTCIIFWQHSNTFYLLTVVCFIVLIHNPMQLFFLDFQLSFGLTFALAWFNNVQTHKKLNANANH